MSVSSGLDCDDIFGWNMAFSFGDRMWTVGLNVEGFFNKNGGRPTNDNLIDFFKKDLKADLSSLLQIQWNDLILLRTVFLRFGSDEAATAFESKVAGQAAVTGGIPWTACGGKRLGGWRGDGSTLVVKIMYVSYEVPLGEVQEELEKYGVVKDMNYSYLKIPGVSHMIQDGVIMARITLNPGVKELPCWVRRLQREGRPAEIWRFQHRGQGDPGCWNCGDLGHIGKRCRSPLLGFQEETRPRRALDRRNVTFAMAVRKNLPPQHQGRKDGGQSGDESSEESGDEGTKSPPVSVSAVVHVPETVNNAEVGTEEVRVVEEIVDVVDEVMEVEEAVGETEVVAVEEAEVREDVYGAADVVEVQVQEEGENEGEEVMEAGQFDDVDGGADSAVGSGGGSLEITTIETVNEAALPVSQETVKDSTQGVVSDEGGFSTVSQVPDQAPDQLQQQLEQFMATPSVLDAARSGSGETSSGASLPCAQGSAVAPTIPIEGSEMELVLVKAYETLEKNLEELTQSPNIFKTQDEVKKEDDDTVIKGEKYSQLSGGLPLGQDPAKSPPREVVVLSSSSEIEESCDGRGVKRKKDKKKDAKKNKQDGGSK